MLPTEPKSQLTVSKAETPILISARKAMTIDSLRQFANKAGRLVIKYPFWALVIGSLGAHTAFALIAPNPLKKTELPHEVIVSTLPVVKLPPTQLPQNSKSNKSIFDGLFVDSSANKIGASPNTFNKLPNSSLRSLDLNSFDNLDDLPPIITSIPPEDSALLNNPRSIDSPQFVKPQARVSDNQTPPASRFTPSGQIDNSNPVKTASNVNNNLKPEFKNGGLKDGVTSSSDPKNPKNTGKDPKNIQGAVKSNNSSIDKNEKAIGDLAAVYITDKQIIDLASKNLIRTTQIAPDDALVSNPDVNREKGISWIPAKVPNANGKKGSVTYMWLVAPNGEIKSIFLKSSGDKELDNIVRKTIEDYKFKPIEDPQSGKYRLVTAKYDFS